MRSSTTPGSRGRSIALFFACSAVAVPLSGQTVRILAAGRDDTTHEAPIPVLMGGTQRDAFGTSSLSRVQVMAVQRALMRAGYDPGPQDGLLGPQVGRALRAFQSEAGLDACGCLDEATTRALGLRTRILHLGDRSGRGEGRVEILQPTRRARVAMAPVAEPAAGYEPTRGPPPVQVEYGTPWYPNRLAIPIAGVGDRAPVAPASRLLPGRPLGVGATRLGRARPPTPRPPGR